MSNAKTRYYGGLGFLNKQDEFDKVFGKHPVLLPPLQLQLIALLLQNFYGIIVNCAAWMYTSMHVVNVM